IIGGFDWGARTANVVAALWPGRCRAMVSVSGYLIGNQQTGRAPLPPAAELSWWYQFYFATERGRAGYDRHRREFAKLIWHTASPQWKELSRCGGNDNGHYHSHLPGHAAAPHAGAGPPRVGPDTASMTV